MCNMFGFFVELFPLLLQLISNPKQFFMNHVIRVFFLWNLFIGLHVHTRERKGARWEGDCWCTIYDNVRKRKKKGAQILAVSKHARTSKQLLILLKYHWFVLSELSK